MYSVQEIQQLKEFFATANVPDEFELSQGVRVVGSKKFIASHLAVLDNPDGELTGREVIRWAGPDNKLSVAVEWKRNACR